jgi:hypothetical protein
VLLIDDVVTDLHIANVGCSESPLPAHGRESTEAIMRFVSLASSAVFLLSLAALAASDEALRVAGNGVNVRAKPSMQASVLAQARRGEPALELSRAGEWIRVRLPERNTVGWIHASLLETPAGLPAPPAAPASTAASEPATSAAPVSPAPSAAGSAPVGTTTRVRVGEAVELPAPGDLTTPQLAGSESAGATSSKPALPQVAVVSGANDAAAIGQLKENVDYINASAMGAAGVTLFTGIRSLGDGVVQVTATDTWSTVPEAGKQSYMNSLFATWSAAAGGGPTLRVEVVDPTGQVLRQMP